MTDTDTIKEFRKTSACSYPAYEKVEKAFINAAKGLIKKTPKAEELLEAGKKITGGSGHPDFEIEFKNARVVSEYAKSVWTGVQELYENCRAHGSMLADGIELGTRDRGQDMWPKLKEDPGRVREDLLHALSFTYITVKDGYKWGKPLSRLEKLHGMFPRQFPSRWNDRSKPVMNDNRPYSDSAVWLINSLQKYLNETGDLSILQEKVKSVNLTKPETPEQSGIVGSAKEYSIAEVMFGILECYSRHADDSPYGLIQIMYGEWCDPIDMFGTSVIGDPLTRGMGRGVNVRLSAQVFNSMVEVIDLFSVAAKDSKFSKRVEALKVSADKLRRNMLAWAWETGPLGGAFINCIHELKRDGSKPDYAKGEKGYTLGSCKGLDFDGINRRELLAQAHSLPAILKERDYLTPVKDKDRIIKELLKTVDGKLYHKKLGLLLFAPPISNDENSRKLVGRMGIVPAGTAENGEYHHAQLMMHYFRIGVDGETDRAWEQFKAVVSATRDESLGGPFEMPSTSYASDPDDPHYGKGMYFGLSGSTDWIVEFLQEIAGVRLSLHDGSKPDISITPRMPSELKGHLTFKRFIHRAKRGGGYEKIPFTLEISCGSGKAGKIKKVTLNGKQVEKPEVKDVSGMKDIKVTIEYA